MSASGPKIPAFQQSLRSDAGSGIAPAYDGGSGVVAAHLPEIYREDQGNGGKDNRRGKGGNDALVAQIGALTGSGIVRTAKELKKASAPPPKGEAVKLATGNAAWTYSHTTKLESNRYNHWDSASLNGGTYLTTNGKPIKVDGMPFNSATVAVPNPSMPNDWNRQLTYGMTSARVVGTRQLMGARASQYNLTGVALRA